MPNGARHWCFTQNNPIENEEWPLTENMITYLIMGKEVGEKGTPHIQGYVVMKDRMTLGNMKALIPRAHLEIMKGSPKQASDYCKKEGNFTEIGTLPRSPQSAGGLKKKENYEKALYNAKHGHIDRIPARLQINHYNSLKRIQQDHMKPPPDANNTTGIWISGPPGVGKSRLVRERYPAQDRYDKCLNKWWDGYQGQKYVLLDDVDISHNAWIGSLLKRWADRYSFPAEVKGTTIQIRPKLIIVTSNYTIEQLFNGNDTMIQAISRRFKEETYPEPIDFSILTVPVKAEQEIITIDE